ncbi:MAG: flavodoxin-dependent (E)-4-hydroxy-3-methylbut-2-enyl-diphosphate synthase [Gammaproteobacteria bacterium]|nr:flavodoxin-dependent (E)-4-hydroxy-3-methylbut-2-enyl-diphosphate synthase [Gammaproteobacteria bacterium]
MKPQQEINRRKTRQIMVGKVPVGGGAPISVQSMTNTETCDVDDTIAQVERLEAVGADIVRVSVPTMDAAEAFREIRARVSLPLVADIHFDYRIALKVLEYGVDCLRINPGNIGKEERVRAVVSSSRDKGIPMRIGVNAGSLSKALLRKYKEPSAEAMIESALEQIDILDKLDFRDFKISLKSSDVFMTLAAYRGLADQIDNPFHLGITEAGGLRGGTVKSSIGMGALLLEGIGDTIRVSLAADPVEEIKVGFDILKSLGLRHKGVNLVACPSCSRQNFDVIGIVNQLESRLEDIVTPVDVAVIGCIVNGPGEAREAEVGLTGASPANMAYLDGAPHHKVRNEELLDELEAMVRRRVAEKQAAAKDIIASS